MFGVLQRSHLTPTDLLGAMAELDVSAPMGDMENDNDSDVDQPSNSSFYATVDVSNTGLDAIPAHYLAEGVEYSPRMVRKLVLARNLMVQLSADIISFGNLAALDLSNNGLATLPEAIGALDKLRTLIARSNLLDDNSFPKSFSRLTKLETLNLSGNQLEQIPSPVYDLPRLKALYLGANRIDSLPCKIGSIFSLEVLYLGGNRLKEVPATIGHLRNLSSLALCDNRLETIPSTIVELQALQSLSLHNNLLRTLPTEIVKLRNLQQLSLRSNPLVHQFIRDMSFNPPSLKELSARMVKMQLSVDTTQQVLPSSLVDYIDTANQCVNPKCKGVYFEACIEHIKFVDFCGKYRVPLLQYLCSPRCSRSPAYACTDTSSDSEMSADEAGPSQIKLKKVLLG